MVFEKTSFNKKVKGIFFYQAVLLSPPQFMLLLKHKRKRRKKTKSKNETLQEKYNT